MTCPCEVIEPCSDQCTCRWPSMSAGCLRCASYGSKEQQEVAARAIARAVDLARPGGEAVIRREVDALVEQLIGERLAATEFVPGVTPIPYAGRVYDAAEVKQAVGAALDFWLTLGPRGAEFERRLAALVGVRHALLCNSGSSANLLAVSALTSQKLDRPLQPGDEVITAACGFPTTLNPILQVGAVPVLVDVELGTYVPTVEQIEAAVTPRTRAIILAHTLGNPFDLAAVGALCDRHGIWLIEDNCDALGSTYDGRWTGSFGDLATQSFYPPHHITMGEGGAVLANRPLLNAIVDSFRSWGRSCWCATGCDNTCGKRFGWQLGELPFGYDHKYIYDHVGYNLKPTDLQAAIGLAQLDKLPGFVAARRRNWERLRAGFAAHEEFFVLPRATLRSDPSWFGFFVLVKELAPFSRAKFVARLEARKVQTRMLFGGNLARQPAYLGRNLRVVGTLPVSDRVMNQGVFLGVYPGLTDVHLDYVLGVVAEFVKERAT